MMPTGQAYSAFTVRRCEDTHGVITFDVNGPRGAADMGPMMCLRGGGGIQLYFLLSPRLGPR